MANLGDDKANALKNLLLIIKNKENDYYPQPRDVVVSSETSYDLLFNDERNNKIYKCRIPFFTSDQKYAGNFELVEEIKNINFKNQNIFFAGGDSLKYFEYAKMFRESSCFEWFGKKGSSRRSKC